jgi:hypothetical protein
MGLGDFFSKAAKAARKADGEKLWESVKGNFDYGGTPAKTSEEAASFMRPAVQEVSKFFKDNLDDADFEGFGKYINKSVNKVHSSSALTGGVYGGLGGGVMGMTSSDRDMGFWKGATMGAISGVRAMKGGISASGATGAVGGAVIGGFSDGSIIGGAFYGAMAGGQGMKYARGGWRSGQSHGFGKGMSATATAMKKDIGNLWKGKKSRTSKSTGLNP